MDSETRSWCLEKLRGAGLEDGDARSALAALEGHLLGLRFLAELTPEECLRVFGRDAGRAAIVIGRHLRT